MGRPTSFPPAMGFSNGMRLDVELRCIECAMFACYRWGSMRRMCYFSTQNRVWVDNYQKRYIASAGDWVIGVIVEKHTENFKVDIGEVHPAILPSLSFEGATKRNRPNLDVGTLMYCMVVMANKHMETELSCISPYVKKEWVTGQGLYGQLKDGYAFECPLRLSRSLTNPKCFVLNCLGELLKFEVAVGLNGKVWVNSGSEIETILITNAILNSEFMNDAQTENMIQLLVQRAS
uniref:Ribosomal RNA-processing protein 40 n=1 Tax=Lotharella globosa TaxID=91324 RepID=A0A7S4DH56_9EUKA|mmetsp:Transcript_7130/g.13301  ORF Transcript_7130/g.13301 Transcript_7130/m.13301 type:complete len:234 (-) Transcript_7130:182-883(-)